MTPLKNLILCSAVLVCHATAQAQTPVQFGRTDTPMIATMPQQRVGEVVFQGTATPVWLVPGPNTAKPQSHVTPVAVSTSQAPVKTPAAQAIAPMENSTPVSSDDWRNRIATLEADIVASQAALVKAKQSLIAATQDEARRAQEQFLTAQRRAEDLKRQAEQAEVAAGNYRKSDPAATKPAPASQEPSLVFELRKSDKTHAAALTRWAEEAKFNLLWEARSTNITFEERYAMPLAEAVHKVVRSLRMAGEDMLMCEYSNRVIRVVPTAATCHINRNIQPNIADGATK